MVDPNREPLGRRRRSRSDGNSIPRREAFFEPGEAGKILVAGAVEVIDRDMNQAKPRRKHEKYLDARSGRIRLAMIADNSAASIEAFVKANVKRKTTLLTDGHASFPGLSDYRHDPRVVGKMAGHVALPWIYRVFALLKRWSLGTYHGLRRKHVDTYLHEFVFRYNRRFYRHVSFETLLGIAAHHSLRAIGTSWTRDNPRKGEKRQASAASQKNGDGNAAGGGLSASRKPNSCRRDRRALIWTTLGQRDKPLRRGEANQMEFDPRWPSAQREFCISRQS